MSITNPTPEQYTPEQAQKVVAGLTAALERRSPQKPV